MRAIDDDLTDLEALHQLRQIVERQNRELETLRGIAKRLRDNWRPIITTNDDVFRREWWRAVDDVDVDDIYEPMTPAEVQAIYGQKENSE